MKAFAQKQNQPKRQVLTSLTRSSATTPESNHYINQTLYLQRTIGNLAVQRLLRTPVEGRASRFSHDFSRIPAHPPAVGTIETKLTVNTLGDVHEQKADAVAEQVLRMATQEVPPVQRQPTEEKRIRRKTAGGAEMLTASPVVHEVLRSSGQPLDPAMRADMEPRFGHDFSRVRVHHDGKAAESAKSINALAYTSGNHIAFADGQYSPTTEGGKRLLAHELVHTLQQGNNVVYRKIDFTEPKPIGADPIPLAVGGTILGSTLPGFNGTLLPKTAIKKDYKEAIFNVIQPQAFNFSATQNGKTCKVDPDKFNINVFAEVRAITEPQKDKWSGSYSPNILSNPPSVCAKNSKTNIQIDMEGKPDSTALYKKVLAHEQEHVTDLKNLSTKELKPYHDFLVGLTGTGKTDKECVDDIFKQVGNKDALAANQFVDKWLDAVQVYDKIGGTHHSKFVTKVDPECAKIQITEKL